MIGYEDIEKRAIPNMHTPYNKCGLRQAVQLSETEVLECATLSILLPNQNPYTDMIVNRYVRLFGPYLLCSDFMMRLKAYQRLLRKGHKRDNMIVYGYLVVIKD